MNINELKRYEYWVGKTPQTVLVAVLAAGGWKNVFPTGVPRWASRVRNYFNVTPKRLERLPLDKADHLREQAQRQLAFLKDCHAVQTFNRTHQDRRPNPWGKPNPPAYPVPKGCPDMRGTDIGRTGILDHIGESKALNFYVYKDENGRPWFQMAAGSTIYHYGGRPFWAGAEAVLVEKVNGQVGTPVFKLVSPDNTGGSCEIILTNKKRAEWIDTGGKSMAIRDLVVLEAEHQGSYNYSETIKEGLVGHERRDVKPHSDKAHFYIDPKDRFTSLASRCFPERDPRNPREKPLAQQWN